MTGEDAVSVAVFNGHCGVDGWGRPYDFWGAFHGIDADIVVLPELFVPDDAPDSLKRAAAPYRLITAEYARARLVTHQPRAVFAKRWGPSVARKAPRALRLEGPPTNRRRALRPEERGLPSVRGSWRLGIATRLATEGEEVIELPHLRREGARRKAIVLKLATPAGELVVAGTHLGHLSHGSWHQIRALGRALGNGPAALGGDMNCWGPPLLALLPGWRRAVRGRSWPAWRPHSQIDHLLVRGGVRVTGGEVLPDAGSDHRPIRATISLLAADQSSGSAASAVTR